MVAHTSNSNTCEAETRWTAICEFKDNLFYLVSAKTVQSYIKRPCLKKKIEIPEEIGQ